MRRRPALALFVLAQGLLCAEGRAQSKSELSTVRFYPAAGPGGFLAVEGGAGGQPGRRSLGLVFDYAANTLHIDRPCEAIADVRRCRDKATEFVRGTGLFHLMVSAPLFRAVQASLDLPVGFSDSEAFFATITPPAGGSPAFTVQPREGFAFADARVAVKVPVATVAGRGLSFAASPFMTLPTGLLTSGRDCRKDGACSFLGERGVQLGANAIGEFAVADLRIAGNLGLAYRPERRFLTARTETEVRYGVAAQYYVTPVLSGIVEVAGAANLLGGGDVPLEARGAVQFGRDISVTAGGAGGLTDGVGNPSFRVFAGVRWAPTYRDEDRDGLEDEDDACPSDAEDRDAFADEDGCPEPDNDGDRIPDRSDACPLQREDLDGFEDANGCPDQDNDADGVPDGYDTCEGAKEDLDGDRDDDGCPDDDLDRDGVPDGSDQCPNTPEDTDGLGDEDGCPEPDFDGDGKDDQADACPDRAEWWDGTTDEDGCPPKDSDGDTVSDALDSCPGVAETLNGIKDADGCPDGKALVVLHGQRLLPTYEPQLADGQAEVGRSQPLIETVASFAERNHRKGSLRVVMVAPAGDPLAAARADSLAGKLRRRVKIRVTSGHVVGEPAHFEIELVPPGKTELERVRAVPVIDL